MDFAYCESTKLQPSFNLLYISFNFLPILLTRFIYEIQLIRNFVTPFLLKHSFRISSDATFFNNSNEIVRVTLELVHLPIPVSGAPEYTLVKRNSKCDRKKIKI